MKSFFFDLNSQFNWYKENNASRFSAFKDPYVESCEDWQEWIELIEHLECSDCPISEEPWFKPYAATLKDSILKEIYDPGLLE